MADQAFEIVTFPDLNIIIIVVHFTKQESMSVFRNGSVDRHACGDVVITNVKENSERARRRYWLRKKLCIRN